MRIKKLNNAAFSLMEILLSAIIFIITVAGVFATLNAVRTPVGTKETALVAAVFGKQILEALRAQVDDPQGALSKFYTCSAPVVPCTDFSLSVGAHQVSNATLNAAGLSWPTSLTAANGGANPVLNYSVTCGNPVGNCVTPNTDIAHRVDLNIKW